METELSGKGAGRDGGLDGPMDAGRPRGEPRTEGRAWLLVAAIVAAYALFLSRYVDAAAGGADSSGYLSYGRLLADGRCLGDMRAVQGLGDSHLRDYVYCPLGFSPARAAGKLAPAYPPGLPLLLALGSRLLGGEHAGDWVMVAHAAGALALMYLLSRLLGVSRAGSFGAVLVLGASPLVLMYSVQAMSDVPAMAWTLASVVLTMVAVRRPCAAFLAGAAFGMAFLVRPTCALAGPVLCLYLWAALRRTGGRAPALAWLGRAGAFAAGFSPWIAVHLLLARHIYGSAFSTGYGDTGSMFSLSHVGPSLSSYATNLPVLLSPLVVAWPLCAALPAIPGAARILVIGVPAAFMAFYSAYFGTSLSWWLLRFVLPAAPVMVAAGVLAVERLGGPALGVLSRFLPRLASRLDRRTALWLAAAFLAAFIWNSSRIDASRHFMRSGRGDAAYRSAVVKMKAALPARSVCLCMQASGAIYYYSDFAVIRSDQLDTGFSGEFYRWAASSGRPLYAALFDWEQRTVVSAPLRGRWSLVLKSDPIYLWKWSP